MVCVRLFAALREAAGTGEVEVAPGTLEQILADLARRYGPGFARLLSSTAVLVDGERLSQPSSFVADEAEVALLPPFSGG